MPVFWNVARMPDAAPRWSAGTAFMIPVVFGAANSPMPMPFSSSSAANDGEREVRRQQHQAGRTTRAASSMPPVANGRAP